MKTVTFDETMWKLVPVEPTHAMLGKADGLTCIDFTALGEEGAFTNDELRAIYRAFLDASPQHPATAAQGDALSWLQANDMAALERFAETADDDESYDIGKEAVQRLAGFGCLRSHGFGKYSITDFGHYVLNDWSLARELPFKSQSERDAARSQAKKGGA